MTSLEAISYINLGDGNHPIDAVTVGGKTVPDVSNFITKSVNDLTNYYLKTETYTKSEVEDLIGAILQFHYEIAASTSAVTSPESNVLYLIGPTGDGADKYEEYVYPNSTAGWTKIGDTTIDLSGYVTTEMLNDTLEDYRTSSEIEEMELVIAGALNDLNERLVYIEESVFPAVSNQLYDVNSSISSLDSRVSTLETNASSYLTSEADPVFLSSPASSITASNISSWNAKQDALVYDSVPTENSDNLVKSGALYSVITHNEYVVATAINDLNDRLEVVESSPASAVTASDIANWNSMASSLSNYVTTSDYDDDQEVIATAMNDLNDRVRDIEESTESDPVFMSSVAASITASDISNWNSTASALSNYVTVSDLIDDEEVISTALNDLNDRVTSLESNTGSSGITGVMFNGVSASISNGVASISVSIPAAVTSTTVASWGFLSSESDPVFASSVAASISAADISNWNSKTSNTGTITGVTFNGISASISNGVASISTTIPDSHFYVATYGVTTGDEIASAIQNGKVVTVLYDNNWYYLDSLWYGDDSYHFTHIGYNVIGGYRVVKHLNCLEGSTPEWGSSSHDYIIPVAPDWSASDSGKYLTINDSYSLIWASESDPVFSASVAASITASDISNWNSKTSNTGTVTGSSLTADKIVLGAGNSAIKNSTYGITTTAPSSGSDNTTLPTSSAVYSAITTALTAVLKYKGTAANNASLPASHSVGDVYVVSSAGTFAGKACEVGDYIICKTSGTSANNAHWDVVNGENQVDNKSASLATAGNSATIATVDGTNITISTPSTWTGVDKTGTLTGISMNSAAVSVSNGVANLGTVLTSHQSIKTINSQAVTGTGDLTIREMPSVSSADNGKVLQVVNGSWTLVSPATIISGSGTPSNSTGNDGDLYLQTS